MTLNCVECNKTFNVIRQELLLIFLKNGLVSDINILKITEMTIKRHWSRSHGVKRMGTDGGQSSTADSQ